MNGISGQDFILGCSAIGAGLAMIAGIGPGMSRSLSNITDITKFNHLN